MRKFYLFLLAMLCVAGTAMAERSVVDVQTSKTLKLNVEKTIKTAAKRTAHAVSHTAKMTPIKSKLAGKVATSMRKVDGKASIEGTWTFDLGDYYFQTSVGSITYDFEATLEGNEVVFEDPTGYELPFVGVYDEAAGTITFNRELLGQLSGYDVYQEPFVYNYDTNELDVQSIVGEYSTYNGGIILFETDNGISWPGYTGNKMAGYFSIYDLEGATKVAGGNSEDEDNEWETVGEATMEDPWLIPGLGGDQHDAAYQWNVPLQRNTENPNLYRLVDPYKVGPVAEFNSSTAKGYITFDLTDPDHVVFLSTEAGVSIPEAGITKFYCLNILGLYIGATGMDAASIVAALGDDAPYTTYKNGVINLGYITTDEGIEYDANFGYQADPVGGYIWTDDNGNAVDMTGSITLHFNEEEMEVVGTYTMTILPTSIAGERTQDKVEIEVEVKHIGENYWIAETGSTNYFKDQIIPFTYSEAANLATFTASYAGEFDGKPTWFSAFVFNGSFTEPQATYAATFDTTEGFEFPGESGFGWFVTTSAEEFDAQDVYAVFYVVADSEMGDLADASIIGDWNFTLNGHYLGEYSLGQFTETFTATLNGNTVTFASSGSQFNIVAEFTAENTLTFNEVAVVNSEASYKLTQSPYINSEGTNELEELTSPVALTATYNAAEGTITFPENSGLRYGYFANGTLSYWDDAFDFVSASKVDNGTDGIKAEKVEAGKTVYYDLSGRRVDAPKFGVYIKKTGNKVQKIVID